MEHGAWSMEHGAWGMELSSGFIGQTAGLTGQTAARRSFRLARAGRRREGSADVGGVRGGVRGVKRDGEILWAAGVRRGGSPTCPTHCLFGRSEKHSPPFS